MTQAAPSIISSKNLQADFDAIVKESKDLSHKLDRNEAILDQTTKKSENKRVEIDSRLKILFNEKKRLSMGTVITKLARNFSSQVIISWREFLAEDQNRWAASYEFTSFCRLYADDMTLFRGLMAGLARYRKNKQSGLKELKIDCEILCLQLEGQRKYMDDYAQIMGQLPQADEKESS